jgi:hypothetical protein
MTTPHGNIEHVGFQMIITHFQPMVEEVVVLMQYLVNPTLLLGGDSYFNHVLNISSYVPSEQGIIPLSLIMLPPSPGMVSFDSSDLIEPHF